MITITETNNKISEASIKQKDRSYSRPGNYVIIVENTAIIYSGSSVDVNGRVIRHKSDLVNNRHSYKELQMAYNNNQNISINITYTFDREEAYDNEQALIDAGICINKALDVRFSGKGISPTEYNIQRIKETHTGKVVSEETRIKLSNANTGKKVSDETKEKLRQINTGKVHSEETKLKLSLASKGRIVSEETSKKISDSKKGKGFPQVALDASMKIRCRKVIINGVIFNSITEAARNLGISDVCVRNYILSSKPEHSGYSFYIE